MIFFKKYNKEKGCFENIFPDIKEIILNRRYINNALSNYNDIKRISDNKIIFCSISQNYDILYIITMNFYNDNYTNNLKIRYYYLEIYQLFNYKFYFGIKCHVFNNFLIFGACYCLKDKCVLNSANKRDYYSTVMFIGYPNGTDYTFNIIDYLLNHTNITIHKLSINLSEYLIIDNNIFGYIYNGIKIINIRQNGYIYLLNEKNNREINLEYNNLLEQNENIKILFRNNIYNISEYILEYSFLVTEDKYEEFDKYPIYIENINGNETESIFDSYKQNYTGKSIFYTIILSENLKTSCDFNCSLCFSNNLTCITYGAYDEFIDKSDVTYYEIFVSQKTGETTDYKTEQIVYYETEKIIDHESEKITEHETKLITNYPTEQMTDYISEQITENTINQLFLILEDDKFYDKNKNIDEIILNIKNILLNYDLLSSLIKENKTSKINKKNNLIYSISSLDNQEDNKINLTTVDIGECESILRNKYNLEQNEPLFIFKIEYYVDGLSFPIIYYEIYTDKIKEELNMEYCKNININIKFPVSINEDNLFKYDISNDYYKDICYSYTTEDNTDIIITDRINEFYNNNMSLCESECIYKGYNYETKKVTCECQTKSYKSFISAIDNNGKLSLIDIHGICYNSLISAIIGE